MARIRQSICYADTRGELMIYKNAKRGASEDAFWDENELIDHRSNKKKGKPRKKRGCPENDFKAHVYVWVRETRYYGKWSSHYGYFVNDRSRPYSVDCKICCGCGKVYTRRYHW